MPLTLTQFQALPYIAQLEALLRAGTHLATGYQEEDMRMLYHLDGFFVELFYNLLANQLYWCDSFTNTKEIADCFLPVTLALE